MGMGRGFSIWEQRWYQPVPDPQNDGSGRVTPRVTRVDPFFKGFKKKKKKKKFPLMFLLFFFLAFRVYIIMLEIKVL